MRIWSFHPQYLDARGLVALWREGLLAQAVLDGKTKGYVHHPQLNRFRDQPSPVGAVAAYLRVVHDESVARGYCFEAGKIGRALGPGPISVACGQLEYEWRHFLAKLTVRDPSLYARLQSIQQPQPHPLFRIIAGDVEQWEKVPEINNRGK